MPTSDSILIEIDNSSGGKLSGSLDRLQGCWKSSSILWMRSNGFPVLDGLILDSWNPDADTIITRFSREKGFSKLLVRMEARGQRWTRRRGGYTIPLAGVQQQAQELTTEGLLTILLEPANPNSDVFSLTSVCDVDRRKIDIEVVGPGFDASDLLRADIVPHERFEIRFDNRLRLPWDLPRLQSTRTHLIDKAGYDASVRKRLIKIGARLRNPSFPDELIQSSVPSSTSEDLAREATAFLKESGNTTLLEHADHYEPISAALMNIFLSELFRLSEAVAKSNVPWRTLSIAAGFLPQDRLVFWDFFPLPAGDHDVRTLLNLKA